jgi:hypothetical protein
VSTVWGGSSVFESASFLEDTVLGRRSRPSRRVLSAFLTGLPRVRLGRTKGSVHTSAFLTGTAPQTEIDVTLSKQTTERFLTGARTAIRLFKIRQLRMQNLARVNVPARRSEPARGGGRKRYAIRSKRFGQPSISAHF